MYAAGAPHPYKGPCLRILTDLEMGVLSAVVNTEILQELLYRYSHVGMADKGIQLCREILNYPLTILPVTEPDVRLAIDLLDVYQARGLEPRDAIHAATMQNYGITRLLSADKDFDVMDLITRVDPLVYTREAQGVKANNT
jgi:predicted nucleic acid-binding protein